ncbi:MAG: hypothetical protein AAGA48_21240 [Myxococcota bacterium]
MLGRGALSVLAMLTSGCALHSSQFFMTTDRPLAAPPEALGNRVEVERCQWLLFSLIPLSPRLSAADLLEEVAAEGGLARVGIEEWRDSYLVVGSRCLRITGRRVVSTVPGVSAPAPRALVVVPAGVEPSEAIVGWPSMPLGTRLSAAFEVTQTRGEEIWVRPADVTAGFHGLEVASASVIFVEGTAQRVIIETAVDPRAALEEIWGSHQTDRAGQYIWTQGNTTATLLDRELRIDQTVEP